MMILIIENNHDAEWALVCWTAGLTIATFLLAFVAAFQDLIRSWIWRPKLDITIDVSPPDCHRSTANRMVSTMYESHMESWYTYYFRFEVHNRGKVSAKNVELILKDVRNENNNHINLSLDNLLWSSLELQSSGSYIPKIYWDYISPGTYQYCNLGYIVQPEYREKLPGENNNNMTAVKRESIFAFSVYWRTPDLRYLVSKGKYAFEIKVGCENGKTITKKYMITLTGFWSEVESEMLNQGFKIQEMK